jgi:hypothetical protein
MRKEGGGQRERRGSSLRDPLPAGEQGRHRDASLPGIAWRVPRKHKHPIAIRPPNAPPPAIAGACGDGADLAHVGAWRTEHLYQRTATGAVTLAAARANQAVVEREEKKCRWPLPDEDGPVVLAGELEQR